VVLGAHRHLPAAAVIEGMRRALTARTVNPEVVLVEARQAADANGAQVVPIGMQALAHYDRPAPTLGSYHGLLDSDQVKSSQAPAHHSQHCAAGRVVAEVSA
jgi:hypothetical protein